MRKLILLTIAPVILLSSACEPSPVAAVLARDGGVCRLGVVGDSLLEGAIRFGGLADQLRTVGCELVALDAARGRTTAQGVQVVRRWVDSGAPPNLIVVALGTNDCDPNAFSLASGQLRFAVLSSSVIWVNTWRPGCDRKINPIIAQIPQIRILDHHRWISENPKMLARDRIHLTNAGYRNYAQRIAWKLRTGLG